MRNRYIVLIFSLLIGLSLSGCRGNPEKAKQKYLESGMKYMDTNSTRPQPSSSRRPFRSIPSSPRRIMSWAWPH